VVVPPPGRFSMTKVWPVCCCTCSYKARGTRSVALPGANGTTIRTVLVGHCWAAAGPAGTMAKTEPASTDPATTLAAPKLRNIVTLRMNSPSPVRAHAPVTEPLGRGQSLEDDAEKASAPIYRVSTMNSV